MNYLSTRAISTQLYSFSEIALRSLAPDGGLYLPQSYPLISAHELQDWRALSYQQLTLALIKKFCGDIETTQLEKLITQTYSPNIFCHSRTPQAAQHITPLTLLGEENKTSLALLELSNGPTLAFKDLALQFLGNLFNELLEHQQKKLTLIGATSGDTGSAALAAMHSKKNIQVFMLSPLDKMSAFQTAQMYSIQDPALFNLAIEGVFDQCQAIVKTLLKDQALTTRHLVSTTNSINWARIMMQVVYYFKAWLEITSPHSQQAVSFAVPCGNFGNICAGHIARMMGLPIHQLIVATNENEVLHQFFQTGYYRIRRAHEVQHTSSPSMDIANASNLERFIFDLLDREPQKTAALFDTLHQNQGFDLSALLPKIRQFGFVSGTTTHHNRLATIRDFYQRYRLIIDPHTANAIYVARHYLSPGIPMVILETAHAIKFSEVIHQALGFSPPCPAIFQNLLQKKQFFTKMPADAEQVKRFILKRI